jgi:hypothetical protein
MTNPMVAVPASTGSALSASVPDGNVIRITKP